MAAQVVCGDHMRFPFTLTSLRVFHLTHCTCIFDLIFFLPRVTARKPPPCAFRLLCDCSRLL